MGGTFGPADRVRFFRNMVGARVGEVVRLVNLPAELVAAGWTSPVFLLRIDGDHRFEAVRADFRSWTPQLDDGAPVVLHDSLPPDGGTVRGIAEALDSGALELLETVDLTTVLRKRVPS